jgi:hypothetical protein
LRVLRKPVKLRFDQEMRLPNKNSVAWLRCP